VLGFTKKYNSHRLVHFEEFEDVPLALQREKRLEKWNRTWKVKLVEEKNWHRKDLYENIK